MHNLMNIVPINEFATSKNLEAEPKLDKIIELHSLSITAI